MKRVMISGLLFGLAAVAPAHASSGPPVTLIGDERMKVVTGTARQEGAGLKVFGLVRPRGRPAMVSPGAHLDIRALDGKGAVSGESQTRWRGGFGMGRGRNAARYEVVLHGLSAEAISRVEVRYSPLDHAKEAGRVER